jgi:hypothetical protein
MSGLIESGGLASHGVPVKLSDQNLAVVTTSVDLFDDKGALIGYCTGIDRSESRTAQLIRHFSSKDGGRVIEQALGPEAVTLRLTGFSLYNSTSEAGTVPHGTLLDRLSRFPESDPAYVFKSLNSQKIPFTLRYSETHPGTSKGTKIYFYGCIIINWTHPVSLGNVTVADTASIQVGQVDDGSLVTEAKPKATTA